MDKPKVSILIPTYNQPNLVGLAVQSALMQDYMPLEVVVCDDSRDGQTKALLAPFHTDKRFCYIQNPERLGRVGNYRQALYRHATGVWALMLDGDDYLTDPCFISEALKGIEEHQDIVFAQGGGEIRQQTEDGRSIVLSVRIPVVKKGATTVSGRDYMKMFPVKRYFLHATTLFHRPTAMDMDFYRKNLLSSDLESFMRLALCGNVLLIPRPVGVWLQHNDNAGQTASMEALIRNSCWADSVAEYAYTNNLLTQRKAKHWAGRVRNREIIGVLMREIKRFKHQNKSRLEILKFTMVFLRRFPCLALHPVMVKKLTCFFLFSAI